MLARTLPLLLVATGFIGLAGAAAQPKTDPKKGKPDPKKWDLDEFVKKAEELPSPDDQVKFVLEKMQDLNPGFRAFTYTKIEAGAVTQVTLDTSKYVTDLSPLRAFSKLKHLHAEGMTFMGGKVADISPLAGLKLEKLGIHGNPEVADLTVLKGMPLIELNCSYTKVASLAPLEGCKTLEILNCNFTRVTNLKPLKGLPLRYLHCSANKGPRGEMIEDVTALQGMKLVKLDCGLNAVQNFAVLKGMPLEYLNVSETQIADFAVLKGMPLTDLFVAGTRFTEKDGAFVKGMPIANLSVQRTPVRDLAFAKGMPLVTLYCNDCLQLKSLEGVEGSRLTVVNCSNTPVKDLKPLEGLPLQTVFCEGTNIAGLAPLKGAPLDELRCGWKDRKGISPLSDLSPLADSKLRVLHCENTAVKDLKPLAGLPLKILRCPNTAVKDLSPLAGGPLVILNCQGTGAGLKPLAGCEKLEDLTCDFVLPRDGAALKAIPALKTLNGADRATVLK